jgi:magnesium-transporting ATPase (P-type)
MEQPPRRVGKRLLGRFLLLRIALGTVVLVTLIVGSVLWVKGLDYDLEEQRATALNVLNFGAISITLSARFSRKYAFHPRSFMGNPLALISYSIMLVFQMFITYTPGVNTTIFSMKPMDGFQ